MEVSTSDDESALYAELSTSEIRTIQRMASYGGAKIQRNLLGLVRLVDVMRKRLERFAREQPEGWIPDLGFTAAYSATLQGGARLAAEHTRSNAKGKYAGLTDDELEEKIKENALMLVEEIPLRDLERIFERRRYQAQFGEDRRPKGQRAQPPKKIIDVGDE